MKKEYRKLSLNEQIRMKRFFDQLHQAAQFIRQHFVGKVMIYETENNTLSVKFSASNFMHLTGILYQSGAASFYRDCIRRHINLDKILVKNDGTTFQKLQVLASLSELIGQHVVLTGSGRYLYLEFDYALRTRKQILALTLKNTRNVVVPQSLLDLKRKTVFPTGDKVIAIYSRHLQNGEITHYL